MQQYRCLLSIQMFNIDYFLDMFRASLCPSSGEKDHVLLHMELFAGSVGCGWLRYCGAYRNQPQPTLPAKYPICNNTRSFSPDDGHKDARNMSRQ